MRLKECALQRVSDQIGQRLDEVLFKIRKGALLGQGNITERTIHRHGVLLAPFYLRSGAIGIFADKSQTHKGSI
jgi:hypothetical protein